MHASGWFNPAAARVDLVRAERACYPRIGVNREEEPPPSQNRLPRVCLRFQARAAPSFGEGASMRLEVIEDREHTIPVLRLFGGMDISTVGELRERLISVMEHEISALALDLSQVTFVDSSGLGTLLAGKKR